MRLALFTDERSSGASASHSRRATSAVISGQEIWHENSMKAWT